MPSPDSGIRGLFLLIIICLTGLSFAQKPVFLKAKITDSVNHNIISNFNLSVSTDNIWTNVVYHSIGDSILSRQITFKFNRIKFSLVGYKPKILEVPDNPTDFIDLGIIPLIKEEITLSEVKIKSRRRFLDLDSSVFKFSDSTFAGYKMAEDVLKLIPGLKIINNQIFYNGVNMTDVKVGNRKFFFDNNDLLLNNLPGYTIDKIEIVQPGADKKNYLTEKPSLNIVLKNGSRSGYLFKALGSLGTDTRKIFDLFLGRIDSTYQLGLTSNYSNINAGNPLILVRTPPVSKGSHSTEHKLVFSKDFQKTSYQFNFDKLNAVFENHQETSRIESPNGDLIKTLYTNNSKNEINTNHINHSIIYRFKPNTILTFSQNILKSNNGFSNITSIVSDDIENNQQMANHNNGFRIDNSLKYNYKDTEAQNKMLEAEFNNLYNDFNYLNSFSNADALRQDIKSKVFAAKGTFTYLFQKGSYLIASTDNNLNQLQQRANLNKAETFSQTYTSVKLKFGANLKKWDYQLSAENFYYNFHLPSQNTNQNNNKILPFVNVNYTFGKGWKAGAMLNTSVQVLTLDQLSALLVNNDAFTRNVNFNISPEKAQTIEFHLEKLSNNNNIYLNTGYINRQNVAENTVTSPLNNEIALKNVGDRKSAYLTVRQDHMLSKHYIISSYLHMIKSGFKPNTETTLLNSETDLLELSLSLQYTLNDKIDATLTGGLTTNGRSFGHQMDNYRDIAYNTNFIFNYTALNHMKLALNFDGQYYNNDFSDGSERFTGIIDIIAQYPFLKNKNLNSFLKINNLLNNGIRNFQDFQSGGFVQTSKISTLGRYFLVGCSFKFNTLKR